MICYIKPFRICVNLSDESYWKVARCPADAVAIDKLSIDAAECDRPTYAEEITRDYQPCVVLHLSAWDLVTVALAAANCGILTSRSDSKFQSAFIGDVDAGIEAVGRAAFPELSAPGETAYFRNQAIASNVLGFRQLQGN